MDARQTDLILQDITEKLFSHLHGAVDPEVFRVLENPDADQQEIEGLKTKIDPEITGRLFSLANAAYAGKLRSGPSKNFYDVVLRLGFEHSKLFILFYALPHVLQNREGRLLFAKSFFRYLIAGIVFAKEFRLPVHEKKELELGALFYEIGRLLFHSFRHAFPHSFLDYGIDAAFIDTHHRHLGMQFCDHFNFPAGVKDMVAAEYFTLEAELVSISGMVMLAHYLVESVFSAGGDKFIIQAPMPDDQDILTHSTGLVIKELVASAGLSDYLIIKTVLTAAQMENEVPAVRPRP
ncbi:MAG TPA: HDOD domain-containing protein [Syntrophales bacterium]|jgi:hypothetical protein|nr:HDOD domain-containing protein [Syntrophales bacterium]HQG35201.1 HDOD domain-containing protein [Syntrophales bacterium]